jgi:hypothetical protein
MVPLHDTRWLSDETSAVTVSQTAQISHFLTAWLEHRSPNYYFHWTLLIFLIVVLGGVHCGIYAGSYNISNTSYLDSPPQPFSFTPQPIPGVVLIGTVFAFTYMCGERR